MRRFLYCFVGLIALIVILAVARPDLFSATVPMQEMSGPIATVDRRILKALEKYPVAVLARIAEIDAARTNVNGDPPRLKLIVVTVFRGGDIPVEMPAVWLPKPPAASAPGIETDSWKSMSNPPPALNSEWILAGTVVDGVLQVSPQDRYSPQNKP